MKKGIAVLLTIALSTALLLGGCGDGSSTETVNKDSGDRSGGFLSGITSSKSTVLSDYLSTEKTIAYEISEVNKSKKPRNVYFFENGTVTIIPGGQFDLELGDFAQMTDEQIWELYETVREAYKENYKTDSSSQYEINKLALEKIYETYPGYVPTAFEYEDFLAAEAMLNAAKGKTYREAGKIESKDIVQGYDKSGLNQRVWICLSLYKELNCISSDDYSKEDYAVVDYFTSYGRYDDAVYAGELFEDAITFFAEGSKKLEQIRSEISYRGPFYDLPFTFVLQTDASGNNVQNECLVYPTLTDSLGSIPKTYYEYLKFANVEGADKEIYDSIYHCFGLGSGDYVFCTRDFMELDTVDSKNVLIDLSDEEMNELFEAEVLSRYE